MKRMKYFCENKDREGTGYLEFLPRKWDGDKYWDDNSIYITPKDLYVCGLKKAIMQVIPDFDVYGISFELKQEQWNRVVEYAGKNGTKAREAAAEVSERLGGNVLSILCV